MWKKNIKLIVFSVVFVIGLLILLNCIKFGDSEVYNILRANGGSMDTAKFMMYLQESIDKFKLIGLILSLFGGTGVIMSIKNK